MDDRVKIELSRKVQTPFHAKMLEHCKNLITMSRNEMGKNYDRWEEIELIYRGERHKDEEDKKACKQGAPSKIVVPLTYAQIQTFVAFGMGLLLQRKVVFELEGTGEEDHASARLGEALLDQNLEHNQFVVILYQFLLDISRFGVGAYKHSWVRETERVWVEEDAPAPNFFQQPLMVLGRLFGGEAAPVEKVQKPVDRTSYVGNRIVSVSPYNIYPDTRLPLFRYQEGEFCGSDEEMTRVQLKRGQADGIYAGIEHIQDYKEADWNNKKRSRRFRQLRTIQPTPGNKGNQAESTVVVTSVQVEIVPAEFKLEDGLPLGDSTRPEKWLVEYANDQRVIRCEPLGYAHNHFTYTIGQFSPDQLGTVNETIADMVSHLQAVIDWFINSHITNVRKHISNRLVVDPAAVVFEDIRDHKPVIRLKPNAANQGVDRYIKQLETSDITRGHLGDVQSLMSFVTMTTAITDNIMGNYHSGRRSAREASNTASASGARLRNIIKLIYDSAIRPSGRDMLSNLRDGLDEEMFVTVQGEMMADWSAYNHFKLPNGNVKVGVSRTHIAGQFDFKVFEGILPSDKHMQAETIEQTLLALLRNPQGIPILTQVLGYDPSKLFTETLELRGVKNPDRFKITQARVMQIQQQVADQQLLEQLNQQQNGQQQPTTNPGAGGQPNAGQPAGAVQSPPSSMQSLLR